MCARRVCAAAVVLLLLCAMGSAETLFNFTATADTRSFREVSDTVRAAGMSKAVFALVQSEAVRHAVFMSVLNPQPNGAGFAGIETELSPPQDWSPYSAVFVRVRVRGPSHVYKIVLKDARSGQTFESFFNASTGAQLARGGRGAEQCNPSPALEPLTVLLPLKEFECYYRGKRCDGVLDVTQIASLGLQVPAGVYESFAQQGSGALEVYWIGVQ